MKNSTKVANKTILANPGSIGLNIAGAEPIEIIANLCIMVAKLEKRDPKDLEISDGFLREKLKDFDVEPSDENIQKIRNYLAGEAEI